MSNDAEGAAGADDDGLPVGRRELLAGAAVGGVGLAGCPIADTEIDGGGGDGAAGQPDAADRGAGE